MAVQTNGFTLAVGILFMAIPTAQAQTPGGGTQTVLHADDLTLSMSAHGKLQKRLEKAVFIVHASQTPSHPYDGNGLAFDGAAAAVQPDALQDILPPEAFQKLPQPGDSHPDTDVPPTSFFGRGLESVSSPFASRPTAKENVSASRQYYLTTADWLTGSTSFTVRIANTDVVAQLDYRDDAQNVAVLSTAPHPKVDGVAILPFDPEAPIPAHAYLMLSPNTPYESLTQHVLHVDTAHLYGMSNHTARNGYPMFTLDGRLMGLSVGPTETRTKSFIIHPGILDRALHPQKYRRITEEKPDLYTL